MSRFSTILITAAICLPLGALLHRDASAERPINNFWDPSIIADHPRLSRAQAALHLALDEIKASQQANELFWTDKTGHASATTSALERAVQTMDDNAEWIRNGMARQQGAAPASNAVPLMWKAPYTILITP